MKTQRIVHAVGHIDGDLIKSAASNTKKSARIVLIRWTSVAACFIVFIIAGTLLLPTLNGGNTVTIGGIERNYTYMINGSESGFIFPWEYLMPYEKYRAVKYGGNEYQTRGREISKDLLGDAIGTCTATGFDIYTDKTYTDSFKVRKINDISEDKLVAVGMDGNYYVYANDSEEAPATLGELLDAYHLTETLSLCKFSVNDGYKERDYYQLSDGAYILQALAECRDAEAYTQADQWDRGDRNYLSFTATSEALGVYKKVFYITEDGYIATNIFNYKYVYFIGAEKASQIISYAKYHAVKAEREPYEYTIGGVITEIGDGYLLIDDTILCKNKKDGMVFRILTADPQISRYPEFGNFKVGDTVAVKFRGEIVLGENNTVSGAVSIHKGIVTDHGLAIPE